MKTFLKTTYLLITLAVSNAQAFTWPTGTPESQSINSSGLSQASQLIRTGDYGNIRSMLVIRNGVLVHEEYFGNAGEKRPVYSVTKSVGSTLLGVAIHNGDSLDLSHSMMDYMPQYNNLAGISTKRRITVHNLLAQRQTHLSTSSMKK